MREGSAQPPWMQTPSPNGGRPHTPLEADRPPLLQTDSLLEAKPPPLWRQTPMDAHLSPVDRKTDACVNITLPQTSFAGGKYAHR